VSVHGEYSRSLEWMIDSLRSSQHPERGRWIEDLEAARVETNPDLSSAAHAGLAIARSIEAGLSQAEVATEATHGLRARCEHLLAHCQIVLGRSA